VSREKISPDDSRWRMWVDADDYASWKRGDAPPFELSKVAFVPCQKTQQYREYLQSA
jgi:hypothetical protein